MAGETSKQKGKLGEHQAMHILGSATLSEPVQYAGANDEGLDITVQVKSPSQAGHLVHCGAQVRAGESHLKKEDDDRYYIKVGNKEFSNWKEMNIPVLFIWVHPSGLAYWAAITKKSSRKYFSISKRAVITPSIRTDISLMGHTQIQQLQNKKFELIRPTLTDGIRLLAKNCYERLKQTSIEHKQLGLVELTWLGWRHLTRKGKSPKDIHDSLQLLPSLKYAIQNTKRLVAQRRLGITERGNWVFERRLLIFESQPINFDDGFTRVLHLALREITKYPSDWRNRIDLYESIERRVVFESIFVPKSKK